MEGNHSAAQDPEARLAILRTEHRDLDSAIDALRTMTASDDIQLAVAAGELSRDQAGEAERRLGEAPQTDRDLFPRLPESAADLVHASEELYDRVSRIDAGQFAEEPAGSPARSLLSRLQRSF